MPRIHREKPEEREEHTAGDQQHKHEPKNAKTQENKHAEAQGNDFDPVRGHNIDIVS